MISACSAPSHSSVLLPSRSSPPPQLFTRPAVLPHHTCASPYQRRFVCLSPCAGRRSADHGGAPPAPPGHGAAQSAQSRRRSSRRWSRSSRRTSRRSSIMCGGPRPAGSCKGKGGDGPQVELGHRWSWARACSHPGFRPRCSGTSPRRLSWGMAARALTLRVCAQGFCG